MKIAEARVTTGRTDLLLRPQGRKPEAEIVRGVREEEWAAHSSDRPLYTGVSCLLVPMECLTGAAYTRKAEALGLTGEREPLMGRVACRYQDWRIGVASQWAQRWVDRNFSLRSLEKILDGLPRHAVRQVALITSLGSGSASVQRRLRVTSGCL
ncbi:hypothetical protein [Streptomyces laurentii]|uniref:hypothetical protein n=1 Tax=Streptomyces laurentii TaxID=39478 RepID=UPI0033E7FD92